MGPSNTRTRLRLSTADKRPIFFQPLIRRISLPQPGPGNVWHRRLASARPSWSQDSGWAHFGSYLSKQQQAQSEINKLE